LIVQDNGIGFEIHAVSAPDPGATFVITLPDHAPAVATEAVFAEVLSTEALSTEEVSL
jgi:hypothetical protein